MYVPKVELKIVEPPAHLIADVAPPELSGVPATNGMLLEWALDLQRYAETMRSDREALRQLYADQIKE